MDFYILDPILIGVKLNEMGMVHVRGWGRGGIRHADLHLVHRGR